MTFLAYLNGVKGGSTNSKNKSSSTIVLLWVVLSSGFVMEFFSCKRDKSQRIFFYRRLELGNSSYYVYHDYLNTTNYNRAPKSANELYEIAKHYVDTSKTDREVNGVTFMAKNVDGPVQHWNFDLDTKERPYYIIGFSFNHFKQENLSKPKVLNSIVLWNNGRSASYYQHFFEEREPDKQLLDSILKSPVPLRCSK